MCHENPTIQQTLDLFSDITERRGVSHHCIGNARQRRDVFGNAVARIDKRVVTPFDDMPIMQYHCNLRDAI